MNRLEVFLDSPKANDDQPTIITKISEDIDFDDVTLHTPNYKRLLWENVSFVLPKGESMLVVGHSGCGKSSLFRALARYYFELLHIFLFMFDFVYILLFLQN